MMFLHNPVNLYNISTDKWNSKKNVLQAITELENDINNVKLSTCTISKTQILYRFQEYLLYDSLC